MPRFSINAPYCMYIVLHALHVQCTLIAGLFTLIGIILFIGGITAESGHNKQIDNQPSFSYSYGSSFAMIITSFVISELTGVLSVYLYISRHKHAYRRKQENYSISEQAPTQHPSSASLANSRSYHSTSRVFTRQRSRDYSPSHSDTLYTYTPVSDSSKEIAAAVAAGAGGAASSTSAGNYAAFPREPSRFTIAGGPMADGHLYRTHAHSAHSINDMDALNYAPLQNRTDAATALNRREIYANRADMTSHLANRDDTVNTTAGIGNRRGEDNYVNNRRDVNEHSNRVQLNTYSKRKLKDDPYARRTTPV